MPKRSKLESILQERCPRCREGQMFISAKYNLKKFDKMHKQCVRCSFNYELEPGFYTGAMYISYAFSVAIFVVVGFLLFIFFKDPEIYVYVLTVLLTIMILFPLLFRYSRVVYLHIFGGVNYDPDYKKSQRKERSIKEI